MTFRCPITGAEIAWAFTYVPESLYCPYCRREHRASEASKVSSGDPDGDPNDTWAGTEKEFA